MDEINLLRDGIPTGIALLFAAVAIATIASVIYTVSDRFGGNETTLRITGAVLCVLGLGIATYVAIKVSQGGAPQCVGGGGGCELVEKSKYSHLFGIHISVFGLIGYSLVLATTIWRGDNARIAAFILTMFGFGFSLYLTYLELYDIVAICQWCVGSAVLMTCLFIVSLTRLLTYYGLDDWDDEVGDGTTSDPAVANPAS